MVRNGKEQTWIALPTTIKAQLADLSQVNPTEYSISRLAWACIERELEYVTKKVQKLEPLGLQEPIVAVQPSLRFKGPTSDAPGARRRGPRK